jgi:subtilisin-like proprotein convertase family protein
MKNLWTLPAREIQGITIGLLVGCSLLAGSNSLEAAEGRELGGNSRNQIESLIAEKASRSPSQRKLDSQLIYALRQKRQQRVAPGLDRLESGVRPRPDGQVLVDLRAQVEPDLLAAIEAGGGTVVSQHPRFQAIRAWVPLELVEALAARPEVRNIRPADEARTNVGPITSQGDITHQAMVARDTLVVDGSGVKVGVLSDSVDYLANSQANGELPFVTVLPGRAGFGSGEGTAMLEIVHDLAPGAQLYFSTAFEGVAAFAQSILDLHAAGCRVIVDDVTYFVESPFQDGPISQAVNEVSAAGTLYFSSAGNSGNLSDGTSSTWEGDFRDGGPATVGRGGRLHSFGAGTLNAVGFAVSSRVDLFWTDPLGQSTNDYDVYLVNASGSVVASSSNVQDGDDDPYEAIGFAPSGTSIVIVKYSGADRYLHLSGGRAPLAFNTSGATRGHNASGASNAFCVAATWVRSPALPFAGGSVNPVEAFNSDGPRRMFFQPDGTPITPGNFSATGGLLLQKPDITAADGVATSVPGFEAFFGTSAAAPHAAAIAALLHSFNDLLTPSEIRSAMESTALDIETLGVDRDSGAGIVMALAALQAPATPVPRLVLDSTILSGGNGNGTVDADECGDVFVTLRNLIAPDGETAIGVVAELRSLTPGVVVNPNPQAFPDIPPAETGVNQMPFRISTTPGYSCATPASFSLHVTTENAGEFNLSFLLASSPPMTGGALTFASTDVPRPIPDPGLVESTILVSNLSLQIEKVRVALYITHSFDSDLVMSLIGPDGTTVELTSQNGGSGANYGTSCAGLTLFDDAASLSITAGSPPFSGAFRPEQPLAAFIGKLPAAANGEWKLRILDLAAEDTGILQCWTLETTPISCPSGGGACLVAPSITAQPVDVFATNGSTLEFTVVARGTEPLYYQWYFNTTNLLAEATNASLTLPDVALDQAGTYSVTVSNFYGTAASAPAQLTVVAPPRIVQSPQDRLATNGTSVQLSVTATGTAPLSYQWFFNATNLLTGSTNPVLTLTPVSPGMAGRYSVLVSNPYGSALSPEAVLEVAVLPFITQQPQSLVVNPGGTAVFNVVAGGSEPLTYRWYFNETNLIEETVGPTLVLTEVTTNDAGGYSVIVSNAYGTVATIEAELSVSEINLAPEVTLTRPTDGAVFALDSGPILLEATATDPDGGIAKVEFFADGRSLTQILTEPYQFEWADAPAGLSSIFAIATDNEGVRATSAVAVITVGLTSAFTRLIPTGSVWKYFDQGVDLGVAWRSPGFDDSAWTNGPAQLGYGDNDEATVVSFGPSITNRYTTTYFRRAFVLTDAGSFTNLVLRLLRDDGAIVYLNGQEIFRSNLPEGVVSFSTLALAAVNGTAERAFFTNTVNPGLLVSGTNVVAVEVHQSAPNSTDLSFELELLGQRSFAPKFLAQPGNQTVSEGSTAVFSANVAGARPLSYQWTFNHTNALPGATNSTLTLNDVRLDNSGAYALVVSNAFGLAVSSNALLTVIGFNDPPTVSLDSPTNGASFGLNVGSILLLATAADPDGAVARVEFFADHVLLGADFDAPYQFEWLDARVGAHELAAVAWDTEGAASTSIVVRITVNITTNSAKLVGAGAVWKYLDTGVDQGTGWRTLGFDDSTWASGPAQLGYGDGDEATVVGFGPSATNRFPTTYFRRAFALTDAASLTNAVIRLLRDDGAVVYLNEVEVFRSNMPTGAITFATLAASAVSGAAESNFLSNAIDSTLLRNGTNLLAVEVHQINATSTDVSFDLELQAERRLAPVILEQPASLSISRGATATFTVVAFGSLPLTYQWYFNETNEVADATNNVLVIESTAPSAAGNYLVVVSNALGTVTSETAMLTVSDTNRSPVVALSSPPGNALFFADAAPIVLEASASDPDGALGQVAFFANGISLGVATAPPYRAAWLDAPLGIHDPWAIATDELGASSTSAVTQITIRFATNNSQLVSTGAVWKYLDTGIDQGTAWRAIDFDDRGWLSGPAELGYGDAAEGRPEATVVSFGPDANNKYITTYFRRAFVLTDPGSFTNLAVRLLRDDGAVVYLNETEIFRSNLPGGDIAFTNLALASVGGAGESQYFTNTVNPSLLLRGTNVLAVEVHQNAGTSTDLSFDLALEGQRVFRPVVAEHPLGITANVGSTATFAVLAEGTLPLSYQWFFNSNPLAGQTGATLVIDPVSVTKAGLYDVTVSNQFGLAFSRSALLTVIDTNNAPAVAITAPADGAIFLLNATPIQIEAFASDPEGPVASVSFFANGLPLGQATAPPYRAEWLDAPLGTHSLRAIATDRQGASSTSEVVRITVNFSTNIARLVSTGAVWKYLDTGVDQGVSWREVDFNDSAWPSGPAELGYGDTAEGRPEATIIGFGPNANNKYPTAYFRRAFVLTDATSLTNTAVRLLRDDGAVVYLNGVEVFRSNMPTGSIAFTTRAAGTVSAANETNYFSSAVDSRLLRNGTNVIAVEVHQINATSTDLSFDLELLAERKHAPFIVTQPVSVVVTNGGSAEFSVVAVGTMPLSYQWYRDQTNLLSGATNAVLTIQPATVLQAGAYSVEVFNTLGRVRSENALLVISGGGNLPPLLELTTPTNGARFAAGVPISLRTAAIDVDGSVTSVTFYADGALLSEDLDSPYEFDWLGAPIGLHAVWAVAVDGEGAATISSIANLSVNSPPGETTSLVSTGSVWKYLDDGTDQGTAWRAPGFDDSQWASGPAELGYGESAEGRPEATVISFGTNSQLKHITYYFRHAFVAPAPGALHQLRLDVLRDDGAVAYLNGIEVFRSNLPGGDINYLTTAASVVSQIEETRFFSTNVSPSLLLEGTNVLAVEVHQINRSSTDVSFDLALLSIMADPPRITTHPQSQTVTNGDSAEFTVAASGLDPLLYQWFFNTTNRLAGATNATLLLSNVTPDQAGSYAVEVRNATGTTYSDPAVLVVFSPPPNLPPTVTLTSPVDGSTFPEQSAIPLASSAADPGGLVAKVEFFADGLSIGVVLTPPYAFDWIGAPLGGHTLRAVATDDQGATNSSAPVMISVLPRQPSPTHIITLISTGSVWKYLDTGIDQGGTWTSPGFDDSVWASGPAELGYGDAAEGRPEATMLGFGPDADEKFPTYYFRRAFALTNSAAVTELKLRVVRDDGAVVYLNGTEVFRDNLPGGPITFTNLALKSIANEDESKFLEATIPVGFLTEGTNVVAVEIHQVNGISTDISFDLELIATRPDAPVIIVQPSDQTLALGQTARFAVNANGTAPLAYQWFRNSLIAIPDATNDTLIILNAQFADEGSYSVVVTNVAGTARSASANLRILAAPVIEAQPQNVTVAAGGSAVFSVVAAGAEPLHYRWFYNTNTELPGANGSTLTLPFVELADAGAYSVTVSNAVGSVSSQPATLRVLVESEIVQVWRTNGVVALAFTTVPGLRYTVDFKGDLNVSTWSLLPGAVKLNGTGSPLTVQDPGPLDQSRFYRIRIE